MTTSDKIGVGRWVGNDTVGYWHTAETRLGNMPSLAARMQVTIFGSAISLAEWERQASAYHGHPVDASDLVPTYKEAPAVEA